MVELEVGKVSGEIDVVGVGYQDGVDGNIITSMWE